MEVHIWHLKFIFTKLYTFLCKSSSLMIFPCLLSPLLLSCATTPNAVNNIWELTKHIAPHLVAPIPFPEKGQPGSPSRINEEKYFLSTILIGPRTSWANISLVSWAHTKGTVRASPCLHFSVDESLGVGQIEMIAGTIGSVDGAFKGSAFLRGFGLSGGRALACERSVRVRIAIFRLIIIFVAPLRSQLLFIPKLVI